jgi:hypothetical protein
MGRKHYYMFSPHPFYFKEVKFMTIKDCIDIVDNLKPNQYSVKEKVMWLSFIEKIIINEVLKTHEGYDGRYDLFEEYSEDKLSARLIVPSPYDRLYTAYLKMKIDEENGEVARYNNSAVLYNTYMQEYRKDYNKNHMPITVISRRSPMTPPKKVASGLTDAEFENLKKELTHILTEYFANTVSEDKMYAIVTRFMQDNAQMLKGKDGKDGANGKDGYTPKKNIDYFDGKPGKAFTYADFTPEQLDELKGPKGDKGDKGDQGARGIQGIQGEKGYTPKKGVDYFTDDEIVEILKPIRKEIEELAIPSSAYINILGGADNWEAEDVKDSSGNVIGVRYGQTVNVNNAVITENSKVDLQITSEQMVIFYQKDLAFVTENDDGVVTVYCVGSIPENDYKIQAIVTEVVSNG